MLQLIRDLLSREALVALSLRERLLDGRLTVVRPD